MSIRKPVEWIGSSRDDLREFLPDVRRVMGQAIDDAQLGTEHPDVKALKGFGGRGVLEVVDDFDGDAYRDLHSQIRRRCLRAACLSKEIEERNCNAAA